MISSQVNNISTNWKDLIDEYNISEIDALYQKEFDDFADISPSFPPLNQIFRCFNYFNIEDTKVILLGQDPYHRVGQAIGLCFGVNSDIKIPPSLRNIKKELFQDIDIELTDTTLEKWAKQGVLLLNASLSVRQSSAASCMKMWSKFTKFIIQSIEERCSNVVFVAWGAFAHGKMENIKNNHLIVSSHPSPLSNKRQYKQYPSFSGSKPFSKINQLLENKIDW
jgi:uracil-DNA glycosylase